MNRRLIPMQCGGNESYTLLFREAEDSVLLDVYDVSTRQCVQTLTTPFPVGGIGSIHHIQSFDVMFFAQPKTHPCKLVRKNKEDGGYEFSFEDNEFLPEPTLEWNFNSDHDINVFAIPDEDLVQAGADGNEYYPKGVLREARGAEELTISHSYHSAQPDGVYGGEAGIGWISVYGFAPTENAAKYQKGKTYSHSGVNVVVSPSDAMGDILTVYSAEEIDGSGAIYELTFDAPAEGVPYEHNYKANVLFKFARVERVGSDGVYFYLGRVRCRLVDHAGINVSFENSAFVSSFSSFMAHVKYGEPEFYVTLLDAPVGEPLTNEVYYKRASGSGFDVALTIDGTNANENLGVGQIIALKYKAALSVSEVWDYDGLPVGTTHSPAPPVEVLEPLLSKLDSENNELRPSSGGGYGNASRLYPVRGKVELKTEGKWSGIIELQELDKEQNLSTIAKITSENALSNTSLSRDIEDFGSSVRVVCTRREKAYQVNKSINGEGAVYSKILQIDDGCQWTLTSEEAQTAYLRIKEKRTLSSGIKCYIAECIGGVNKSFSTSSYALGAWGENNGYPEHITIYQERLVYAGNKTKPMTLWMSKTNKWTDFELGTNDSSSITATLATEKYDKIQWVLPNKNGILIGTQHGEFSLGGSDGGVATANNITATATSNIGSSEVSADVFGTATIMVKTGGKELYRIDYNTLSEESAGNQISLLASHLFEDDPVVDMLVVKAPSNMLFCLHESGKLSSLTYEPEYSVTGWAQHSVLDGVDCACVFRVGGKDSLCLVVKKGDKYILGELDLTGDVWTDDGEKYESFVKTTPLSFDSLGNYGRQLIIAGCDIYVGKGTKQFDLRLHGGDWTRVDNGFGPLNNLRSFETQRVEAHTTSAWVDEATVEIKSSSAFPLVIHAIGASVRK